MLGAGLVLGWSSAQAEIVIRVQQAGANIRATASGSLTTDAFGVPGPAVFTTARVAPGQGFILVGDSGTPAAPLSHLRYFATSSAPIAAFGAGGVRVADSAAGDLVGLALGTNGTDNFASFLVPETYVSDAALRGSATWLNTDFAGLGLLTGQWLFSAPTDAGSQELRLIIGGTVPVPAPGGLALFVLAFGGLVAARRRAA
ncbi:hypothetical protein CKO45_22600 [Paracraurococcus ruber]|uniref:PEP-CTERM protein-sorting domain-containing protein n=2 Tax=Paracraurococcus ruber TaxID=77675 RepID=A0ABS1D312_9PROT|nr:hypothetical protein [Paracraurococcus ruber]